jgi:hypothetical protein
MNRLFKIPVIIFSVISILSLTYCKKPAPPTVETGSISAISYTTAISGGVVTKEGSESVVSRGVCWNSAANPTTANYMTVDGSGIGSFISSLTNLTPNTIYYVRAYAINSAGTSYGSQVTFTTSQLIIPTLTTTTVSSITTTSAVSGGNITADGGGAVTARGVCWATTANPTISNSKTSDGTGTGSFTSNVTGLLQGTAYHIRAYATNSAGTAYGNDLPFSTTGIPTVTTSAVTSVTSASAAGGGNVTSDGGLSVTARGVCWSTSTNPTIANSKTTDGTGTGVFTSSITGLAAITQYYVRSYATNSVGTAYGENITFTTPLATLHDPVLVSQFNDDPTNHNMHIATDGNYYYTCNGGNVGTGKINKYTLAGVFVASYPIALDMRSVMYNKVDNFLYASGFESNTSERNIYKITNIVTGTFVKLYTNLYDYNQAGVALSDDGLYLFAFNAGTLKKYRLSDGVLVQTLTGLSYGTGNFGGDGAVAVDPDYIYTWNAVTRIVYVYNHSGTFIRSLTLTNGNCGLSLSLLNGYLFVANDGNYSVGTWFGYNIRRNLSKGSANTISTPISKPGRVIDKNDSSK